MVIFSSTSCALPHPTITPSISPNSPTIQPSSVKFSSKDDLQNMITDIELCLKNIIKSGADTNSLENLNVVLSNLDSMIFDSPLLEYSSALDVFLTYLKDFKDGDETKFKEHFSKYKELESENLKLNLNETEYFLLISSIRERARMKDSEIVLTFAGDCSFGTYPQAKPENKFDYVMEHTAKNDFEYNFKNCFSFFKTDDLTIANNETAISSRSKMVNKLWQIKSDPKFTPIYKIAGVDILNLANNHTMDCFSEGYQDTLQSLSENNLEYFDADIPLVKNVKGVQLVLLGYSVLRSQASEAIKTAIINDIEKHKTPDNFVIVNMHWGKEYSLQPVAYQKDYAYAFVDAGADLIIGAHPHIMEGIEKYNEKYILYSIGDFCFGGDPDLESRMTALFRFRIETNTRAVSMEIVPYYENSDGIESGYNNFQPTPLFGDEGQRISNYLASVSQPLTYGITQYNIFDPF